MDAETLLRQGLTSGVFDDAPVFKSDVEKYFGIMGVDYCDHCHEQEAVVNHRGLDMWFCSESCIMKELTKRRLDAELDRRAEISSGGQV